jgi:hypothetical protein
MQIRKFPWRPRPQIGNPQICKEKSRGSDSDPHRFASYIFFYLRKYILDYKMICNSALKNLSPKPKVVVKFEWERFKLYIYKENNYAFAEVLSPQKIIGSANRKSANAPSKIHIWSANRKSAKWHICGMSANLKQNFFRQFAYLRFVRNLFVDRPPLLTAKGHRH